MRIICLDDHTSMLDCLVRELQMIAPTAVIHAFQDTETALEFTKENGCDVLFSEIDLYGKDGLLFAEKVQAINPRVNIIFTTVCEESERAKDVFRLHPSGYITKPYTREQLSYELSHLRFPVEAPEVSQYRAQTISFSKRLDPLFDMQSSWDYQKSYDRSYLRNNEMPVSSLSDIPNINKMEETSTPVPAPEKSEPEPENTSVLKDKDLRRMSRAQLLELLIVMAKENESLKTQLKESEEKVKDRTLNIENAGSIADAALKMSGIFEAAQKAADVYLENVHVQSQKFAQREKEFNERAERIIADARSRCAYMESETSRKCKEMTQAAEYETKMRWEELHTKLESYLQQHEQLRSLLQYR